MRTRACTIWRRVALETSWEDILPTADVSLDAPITEDSDDSLADAVPDPGPSPEEIAIRSEQTAYLDRLAAKAKLSDRERELVRLRFAGDLTRPEVRDRLGVTKQLVHAREAAALEKLRKAVAPEDPRW